MSALLQVVDALDPQSAGFAGEIAQELGGAVLTLTPRADAASEPLWRHQRVLAPAPNEGALAAWHRALDETNPQSVFVQHLGGVSPAMLLDLREREIPYAVFLHDFGPLCPTFRLWHRRQELCSGPGRTGLKCAWCVSGRWSRAAELPLRTLFYRHRPQNWRTALVRADALVAPSRFARDFWIAQGAPPERLAVIAPHLGLPPLLETPGPPHVAALARPAGARQLLYAGGWDEAAGAELLASALEQIRTPVQLIAWGPYSAEEERRMREAVSERHAIVFVGGNASIPELAVSCSVTVVPSRWDVPYSRLVRAAQSVGARVAATAVGGIPEQIIHGVNGYLAAPDDPGALAEALQEALSANGVADATWGGDHLVAANAQAEAQRSRQRLHRLLDLLEAGTSADPAVELEHGDWLRALPSRSTEENTEALISALRLEGIGGSAPDAVFQRRAHAGSRARRVQLNHAVAFFRGSGCRRIVYVGGSSPAPDAEACFAAWGLLRVAAEALPDGIFEEREEGIEPADPAWLRHRFPQAKAWVSTTNQGIETQSW